MAQLVGVDVRMYWKPLKSATLPGGRNVELPKSPVRKARPSKASVWSWARSEMACSMEYPPPCSGRGGLSGSPSSPGRPRLGLLAGGPPSLG